MNVTLIETQIRTWTLGCLKFILLKLMLLIDFGFSKFSCPTHASLMFKLKAHFFKAQRHQGTTVGLAMWSEITDLRPKTFAYIIINLLETFT